MTIYNITDYGAVADSNTVCTKAIQRAIDLCGEGQTVYIPKGCFVSGALFLKSNMTLFHGEMKENRGKRGRALCIRNTENVTLKNITIRQSPAWCLHLVYCTNVLIDGAHISGISATKTAPL